MKNRKLDVTGLNYCSCRHCFTQKAVNMNRHLKQDILRQSSVCSIESSANRPVVQRINNESGYLFADWRIVLKAKKLWKSLKNDCQIWEKKLPIKI